MLLKTIISPIIENRIPRTVLALSFVNSKNGRYEFLLSGAKNIIRTDAGINHFATLVSDLKPFSVANKSPIPMGIEYNE